MRRVVFSHEAQERLEVQIEYLLDRGAPGAARTLRHRVDAFLSNILTRFPGTGAYIQQKDLWESWIPRTRLVVWYRFDDDALQVVTVWHTSQDRQSAP